MHRTGRSALFFLSLTSLAVPATAQHAYDALTVAREHARADNQRILLRIRGDDAKAEATLDARLAERRLARLLLYEYRQVALPRDSELTAFLLPQLGLADQVETAGNVLYVVDAFENAVVATLHVDPDEGDDLQGFLREHVAAPVNARAVLDAALSEAKRTDRRVFVQLSAPWCSWCHKLTAFLHHDEVEPRLTADWVLCKIDIDRMDGGVALAGELRGGKGGGIPWSVVLDADGRALVDADGPNGNIGCPSAPAEIEHFLGAMLDGTRQHMTERDRAVIARALEDYAVTLRGNEVKGSAELARANGLVATGAFDAAVTALGAALANGAHPSHVLANPDFRVLREDAARREALTSHLREHAAYSEVELVDAHESGRRFRLEGIVIGADGEPAVGAVVRLFHTDARGEYRPGMTAGGGAGNPRLGGFVRTDADGRFVADTVMPIRYAGQSVPRHVHYRVELPGREAHVSECLFADDPGLTDDARASAQGRGWPIVQPEWNEAAAREVARLRIDLGDA